ncbi:hypothetical protein NLG97_g2722 [Lecanicillium saksenae]|uniref:Uncharacterized protein n=1 Tax=Lecanicillium saksenae TaxID=468837 RepID=A0ACC1R2R3_9HYPO|nr:hypothetical protein NLG97_g2722 [Lecanicillium saksenae]
MSFQQKPAAARIPTHHPNKMMYSDSKGEKHEIHIPARDYYKAMEHYKRKEWDELAKFPAWAGQRYTEADDLNNITNPKDFFSVPPPPDDAWFYPPEDEAKDEAKDVAKE